VAQVWLLLAMAPWLATYGEVAVSAGAERAGVAWAAQLLADECQVPLSLAAADAGAGAIRAGLVGDALVADVKPAGAEGLSSQGFGWVSGDAGVALVARDPVGLMYGLLELRDRLHNGEAIAVEGLSEPFLKLRGDYIDLPFYLGCDLYDGRWRWHRDIEGSATSWFHDRAGWTRRLQAYALRRVNNIELQHPHPFPAFITYPDTPEAAYFDDATVARNAETLRWLIDEAAEYGIGFYIQTWNEWIPRKYAEEHNLPQEAPGTPESAALNRYSYRELFRRFPGLAGLVTMAAESPPGCVAFVRDNVVRPLGELPNPPKITYWTWCSFPEDVNVVLDGYPGETAIMHYLQYEQLFKPMIDPRVGRTSRECGNRPVTVLGGLGTATGQLYWGDPFVIRDIIRDAPKQNVDGIIFCGLDSWSWVSDKWIGWEALARYWWDPRREDTDGYWERRIAEVLGDEAFGRPLLSAYTHASAVPMRILCLLHSQSDVFRPQYGLALPFYLGMPTLSTYVFENHEKLDEQGRLVPRMGLAWPNPDWGEKVIGVLDYVDQTRRGEAVEGTTPVDIADDLDGHAAAIAEARAAMAPLRDWCKWGPERFDTLQGVLEVNELLARHVAAKVRAAMAWERWNQGIGPADAVLAPLDESVERWAEYAAVAERLYPNQKEIGAKRNVLTKPWREWTHLDLWNHYQYEPTFRFSDYAQRLRRERDLIAGLMADGRHELPFEPDLLPPVQGKVIAGLGADGPFGGLKLNNFPPKATARLEGGRLIAEQQGTRSDFYFPFVTDPAACPLEQGVRYELIFRYAITRSGAEAPLGLSMGARTTEGTWHKDVGARYFYGSAGAGGEIRTQFVPKDYDDYYIYLSLNGDGVVEVENVRLVREGE